MKPDKKAWIALLVLALPGLLVTMDLTVLFLAVPSLTADLAPGSTELLWITDIYGFLIAGSLIVMGALGDRLGRRRVLLAGAARLRRCVAAGDARAIARDADRRTGAAGDRRRGAAAVDDGPRLHDVHRREAAHGGAGDDDGLLRARRRLGAAARRRAAGAVRLARRVRAQPAGDAAPAGAGAAGAARGTQPDARPGRPRQRRPEHRGPAGRRVRRQGRGGGRARAA